MGGFTPRGGTGATATEVWAYATRLLTNLSNIRAGYIDLLNDGTVGLAALAGYVDEEKDKEHETEWNTNPVVDNVTSLALTPLTTHTISAADFVYPTGATERRVILLAMISAQAQANFTHHIGIVVRRSINDVAWADLLNLTANPPLGLSTEASMGNLALPIDITALVASGDKLEFRFQVDSDDAGSVNYTTSFIVVLVYRMAA